MGNLCEILGKKVLNIESANIEGSVVDFVFTGKLDKFLYAVIESISDGTTFSKLLCVKNIYKIDEEIIVIKNSSAIIAEQSFAKSLVCGLLANKKAYTTSGRFLGTVENLSYNNNFTPQSLQINKIDYAIGKVAAASCQLVVINDSNFKLTPKQKSDIEAIKNIKVTILQNSKNVDIAYTQSEIESNAESSCSTIRQSNVESSCNATSQSTAENSCIAIKIDKAQGSGNMAGECVGKKKCGLLNETKLNSDCCGLSVVAVQNSIGGNCNDTPVQNFATCNGSKSVQNCLGNDGKTQPPESDAGRFKVLYQKGQTTKPESNLCELESKANVCKGQNSEQLVSDGEGASKSGQVPNTSQARGANSGPSELNDAPTTNRRNINNTATIENDQQLNASQIKSEIYFEKNYHTDGETQTWTQSESVELVTAKAMPKLTANNVQGMGRASLVQEGVSNIKADSLAKNDNTQITNYNTPVLDKNLRPSVLDDLNIQNLQQHTATRKPALKSIYLPEKVIANYNFLIGRVLIYDIFDGAGKVLIGHNCVINKIIIDRARKNGKLFELTASSNSFNLARQQKQ